MNTRVQRRLGWKGGILFVVVCIIIGLLVGAVITKAQAAEDPDGTVYRCADSCSTARVYGRYDGKRKYRNDRLGHPPRRPKYPPRIKKLIVAELLEAQRRNNRTARVATYRTAGELWTNFTRHDSCVARVDPAAGARAGRPFTCDAGTEWLLRHKTDRWNRQVVRGTICGGIAGISVRGALAASAGGPWVWAGIGAGALACMWGQWLENQAN